LDGTGTWLDAITETGDGESVPRWFFNFKTGDWMSNDYDYFDYWTEGD